MRPTSFEQFLVRRLRGSAQVCFSSGHAGGTDRSYAGSVCQRRKVKIVNLVNLQYSYNIT
jgi:hypothetical protein